MRVEIFQGSDHQWYWRAKTRNGRVVAVGGEGYTRRVDCLRAWLRFKGRFGDDATIRVSVLEALEGVR